MGMSADVIKCLASPKRSLLQAFFGAWRSSCLSNRHSNYLMARTTTLTRSFRRGAFGNLDQFEIDTAQERALQIATGWMLWAGQVRRRWLYDA